MKFRNLIAGSVLALAIYTTTIVPVTAQSKAEAEGKTENRAQGDYIESRSASVYAGPCHYSNEAVTGGNTATLAWRFTGGTWNSTKLDGLNAVAVVSADANLATDTATRRSVLYLDARATPQQVAALRALFTQKYSAVLGQVKAVKAADVLISNDKLDYRVRAGDAANLDINRYPCRHCTQDAQIWYQPFVAAENVIVGKTTRSTFRDTTLGQAWDDRQEANSAFVGTFSVAG